MDMIDVICKDGVIYDCGEIEPFLGENEFIFTGYSDIESVEKDGLRFVDKEVLKKFISLMDSSVIKTWLLNSIG